jgi:hypothetical protein
MLDVVFTLDYEIHGNGDGSPWELMVEPTRRLLMQLDRHGAKLTIMADVAEIIRFRQHLEETGRDDFHYRAVAEQLKAAVAGGHDVQLHIHPSYFNATFDGGWSQDYSEYDIASLSSERLDEVIGVGKGFLEDLLTLIDPGYQCVAFRAANWSMHPSPAIVDALVKHGIRLDSSVFKYGHRNSLVSFDYRHAHSALVPWPVDRNDICRLDPHGRLTEVPIYCERRRLAHFLSLNRLWRAAQTRRHAVARSRASAEERPSVASGMDVSVRSNGISKVRKLGSLVFGQHAWKLDFNQCSGRQLVAGLERVAERYDAPDKEMPLVLIGHSKTYNRLNERQLEPFLTYVRGHPERFRFSSLRDLTERPWMAEV